MIEFYGQANPRLQKAIINLCFYNDSSGIALIDKAIIDDKLSGEQVRMLPLLYNKTSLERFSTFSRSRIRGMYKHTLSRNHLLLIEAIKFKKKLNASGYEKVLFLKGAALLFYEQRNFGQRPMADIDVLVPDFSDDFDKAISFINNFNYKINSCGLREVSIVNDKKIEFDIHWYLAHGALKKRTVDKMLGRAIKVHYYDTDILVPCYEHQLAHLIVHGVFAPTLTYDARWVIDAIDLLSYKHRIDPNVFLDFVEDFTFPSKIKYGIDLIVENIKSNTLINKKALREISENIKPANNWLGYFYNQKARPNLAFSEDKKQNSWIKSGICTHIIEPIIVARYNRRSYLESFALALKFPPPSICQAFYLLFIKIYSRFFYRLSIILKISQKKILKKIMIRH